jgi:hypothetical protein
MVRTRERGSGIISVLVGVPIVLVLMLLAVQVLTDLYARSVVSAAAFDGARIVAGQDGGNAAIPNAEDHVRRVLGRFGHDLRLTWSADGDRVALRVEGRVPSVLPLPLPLDRIDRTARARTERWR